MRANCLSCYIFAPPNLSYLNYRTKATFVCYRHKTQKRDAAQRAASLFWVLICPDTSSDIYKQVSIIKTLKPKKLWRTRSVRHSFFGFGFYYAYSLPSERLALRREAPQR